MTPVETSTRRQFLKQAAVAVASASVDAFGLSRLPARQGPDQQPQGDPQPPDPWTEYGLSREEYETRLNNAAAYTPESIRNDPNWHFNPEIYSYETTDPVTGDTLAYAHGLGTEKNADGRYIDDDLEKGRVVYSEWMKGEHFKLIIGISNQHPYFSKVGWDTRVLQTPEVLDMVQTKLFQ